MSEVRAVVQGGRRPSLQPDRHVLTLARELGRFPPLAELRTSATSPYSAQGRRPQAQWAFFPASLSTIARGCADGGPAHEVRLAEAARHRCSRPRIRVEQFLDVSAVADAG